MTKQVLSRRTFLMAAGVGVGVGATALLSGCNPLTAATSITPITNPPKTSPMLPGPYKTSQVILGEDTPLALHPDPQTFPIHSRPEKVLAAVYFPYFAGTDHRVPTPNPLHITKGPFPFLLYAHAYRAINPTDHVTPPADRDFTSVDVMLRHVASYGCVAIAPDLSWLQDDPLFELRGQVLMAYYEYLSTTLNAALFANQVDLSRVILVGHSRGGGGAVHAGRALTNRFHFAPVAYGLIAPERGGDSGADIRNLVVLGGSLDGEQGAEPQTAYMAGGTPKTLVTIPGANHYGYTDICPYDNSCSDVFLLDSNGTISRTAQQQTAAAYLAALLRFYARGDVTARPYLIGSEPVEGLEIYSVRGIQVQSQGFPSLLTPGPNQP